MAYCRNCGITIDQQLQQSLCPKCQATAAPPADDEWVAIARIANLAEAGFLSELLETKGVVSRLERLEDFSAVDGHWRSQFVLRVPPDHHSRALDLLRDEVAAYQAEEDGQDEEDSEPVSILDLLRRLRGVPAAALGLLLVMVALSAYTAGRATKNPRAPNFEQSALWRALIDSPNPYFAVSPDGKLKRCLRYDPRERKLVLEVDTTGDGRFDTRREFREDSVLPRNMIREP